MSADFPSPWFRLEPPTTAPESLSVRLVDASSGVPLFAGLGADGRRHYLLASSPSDPPLSVKVPRGLVVSSRDLSGPDTAPTRYLDIACTDPLAHHAFDLLASDLLETLRVRPTPVTQAASDVLSRWKRFWSAAASPALSKEEQIGLYAEIWFLSEWLLPTVGPFAALSAWRGPFGSPHDFTLPSLSVEVKATMSHSGVHRINGVDQLEPPPTTPLFLFSASLCASGQNALSLPALVSSLASTLSSHPTSLELLEAGLASVGYDDLHAQEYESQVLSVTSPCLYAVIDEFPRITRRSLPEGLPLGVSRLEYSVDLSGFGKLVRARDREEFRDLLPREQS